MSNKKLGLEPAFTGAEGYGDFNRNGISKRLYIATAAMQGMLANSNEGLVYTAIPLLVKESYIIADEMLKQENNE